MKSRRKSPRYDFVATSVLTDPVNATYDCLEESRKLAATDATWTL